MSALRFVMAVWSVTRIGVATIPQRLGSATVVVIGIAGVVGVLIAILAMGAGFEKTLLETGSNDTAIVLQGRQRFEGGSSLDPASVALVSQLSHIRRNASDQPMLSPEQLTAATLPKKSTGLDASIALRGVGERVWEVWPHIELVAGRKLQPGLSELMVGKGAYEKFAGLELGSKVTFDGQPWRVVGVFESGDARDSELWVDVQVFSAAYRRGNTVNSLIVRLRDDQAFRSFEQVLESDPRLEVNVQTTRQYYQSLSEALARMIRIVGHSIGAIMALGAVFSALNATYMAVATRAREIATLRAMGFERGTLIVSVVLETMLLAALGGALGAAITWLLFDGFTASTLGGAGQIVFAFDVSPQLIRDGLIWALTIGLVGGLFPAIRAARLPIVAGLREL